MSQKEKVVDVETVIYAKESESLKKELEEKANGNEKEVGIEELLRTANHRVNK